MFFTPKFGLLGALMGAVMMKQMGGVRPLQFQAWVGFASFWPLAALSLWLEPGQIADLMGPRDRRIGSAGATVIHSTEPFDPEVGAYHDGGGHGGHHHHHD